MKNTALMVGLLLLPLPAGVERTANGQAPSSPPTFFDRNVAPAQDTLPLAMLPPAVDESADFSTAWEDFEAPPPELGRPINYQRSRTMQTTPIWFDGATDEATQYSLEATGRAYYFNDQRIEWTGLEATFGAEGVLAGVVSRQEGDWTLALEGELYFNQPYDRNILVDTPVRRSFAHNFDIQPIAISQLLLTSRRDDLLISVGKMVTPFGRTYFPLYRNDFSDGPFIRTESILWRETGVVFQYDPDAWVLTAGIVNGSLEQDTNSSKALVSRAGIDLEWFAAGASVKWQDGIGSEHQKRFNKHFGADAMVKFGSWRLSGEVIYDYYGSRKPGVPQDDVTWGRSIYNRDLNQAWMDPITGVGYYVNAGYTGSVMSLMLNYGQFFPEKIGDPMQDTVTRRGIIKAVYHRTSYLDYFAMMMLENGVPVAQNGLPRGGNSMLFGFQYSL